MSVRAGILVTGTEVLSGRVADRNGPWLAERLEEAGVDLAHVMIVGDRREDVHAALRFMAAEGLDLVVTSGGLGPTADDLTAEVVAEAQGREMVWDGELQARIEAIVAPFQRRWRNVDPEAMRAGARKQATIPQGATVLDPVGTAPGLVVTPAGPPSAEAEEPPTNPSKTQPEEPPTNSSKTQPEEPPTNSSKTQPGEPPAARPTIVVLPGPPRELQPMWEAAVRDGALRQALGGGRERRSRTMRLFGIPESEIAETLRRAERAGIDLGSLEITTCLKRGEVEIVTRYEPRAQEAYEQLAALVRTHHADTLFSEDGSTIDEQVAVLATVAERARRSLRCAPALTKTGTDQGDTRFARIPESASAAGECPPASAWTKGPLTIAVAESCTGGLMAARLTDLPGASEYVRGAIVAYANDLKSALAGVPAELIERHGAVSPEVAQALAEGARTHLGADVGVGITGIAGPGGGTPEKPVGLVCLSVAGPGESTLTRSVTLPGTRADVRERATTVALHMVRRALLGQAAH